MSFSGSLAPRQKMIWSLRRRGFQPVEIAEKLNTSRQFVHQTLNAADAKVSSLLTEMAEMNRIEIQHVDVKNGILAGYHRGLETQVVICYSGKNGLRVWYWYENPDACEECKLIHQCKNYLLDEAEEYGIPLTPDEKKLQPAKLARTVFSRLMPELKP
jgi:hypothetical protein